MHRLVSSAAAQAADRAAETEFGYPSWMLMEEAGIRLQDQLDQLAPPGPMVYLAGPGNNGGDAWVMARQAFLRGRSAVTVVTFGPPSSENARLQAEWGARVGLPHLSWSDDRAKAALESAGVWVDGLWGSGLEGPLRPSATTLVLHLEALRRQNDVAVAAIDVPSGLWSGRSSTEPVLSARWTLSPGPLKDFLLEPTNRGGAGELVEVPVSFPRPAVASATLWNEADLGALVPPISRTDHKGRRGHVAVVGGGPGTPGAVVLAARSAAAAGAGLVTLGVDAGLVSPIAAQVPAFMVREAADLTTRLDRFDAVAVGPGWGRDPGRLALLSDLWSSALPLVVDAEALDAWVALGKPPRSAPTLFTPHPGEFRRAGFGEATVENAVAWARHLGGVVVLKGAVTWIVSGDHRAVWDGHEPALGTGGSGDCLAGVVGAFLAVGQDPFQAASAAVVLHGVAGRALARQVGWFTADRLPEALATTSLACRTGAARL